MIRVHFAGGVSPYANTNGIGGYGGGGGAGFGDGAGGGGGGYSGGGGANGVGAAGAGGGGSFFSTNFSGMTGTNGANSSNGYVSLSILASIPNFYWATNTQSWAVATNWSSNTVPTNTSAAYIDNGGTAILSTNGYAGSLTVGSTNSAYGFLVITNGGNLSIATNLIIGSSNGSAASLVTVTGSNASLSNSGSFYLGYSGNSNSLIVSNGAKFNAVTYGGVGYNASATGNVLLITGPGSLVTSAGNFDIGFNGRSNSLILTNGGQMMLTSVYGGSSIGSFASGGNNSVLITGSNSLLTNTGIYYVGFASSSNQLTVSSNGTFASGSLTVGDTGSNNAVLVSNGGRLSIVGNTVIGNNASALSNSVFITGAGSTLSNGDTITIGNFGSGSLTIASGGSLISSNITIASQTASFGTVNVGTYGGNDTNVNFGVGTVTMGSGTAILNFNQADKLTISSVFSQTAGMNNDQIIAQIGSGTTVLTGVSSQTNDAGVIVNRGQLTINGGSLRIQTANFGLAGTVAVGINTNYLGTLYTNTSPASLVISNGGSLFATRGSESDASSLVAVGFAASQNSLLVF